MATKTKPRTRNTVSKMTDPEVLERLGVRRDDLKSWMDSLLSEADVCNQLSIKLSTLRTWRCKGSAPKGIKIGRATWYRPEAVAKWIFERELG